MVDDDGSVAANTNVAPESKCDFHIVGVGASAGGLEALEAFFREMPTDTGAAFVVVQHLSPDFKSHMEQLLSRHTTIPVFRVEDQMEVKPNSIYLIPPRKEMIISGGKLLLTDKDPQTLTHPIDQFFRSLATDCGKFSVGVILSGTGSDGSRGIRDIHDAGGLVIAQSETTAKFDGMPLNAIESGIVDVILSPDAMATAIDKYVRDAMSPEQLAEHELPQEQLEGVQRILQLLRVEFGLDFSHYKPATVARRVRRRVELNELSDLPTYIEQLQNDRGELNDLYKDLLIGVTRFFRDTEAFERLETKIIPEILEKTPVGDPIRVWTAGCATGEEAYSIAMLFHEQLTAASRPLTFKMFATDVHRASIQTAATGVYSANALAEVSPERRARYFSEKENGFHVASDIRQMIVFAPHNVITDAPFTQLDLVTCRNLLIYLLPTAQKKAISLFHFALKTSAIMMLGPSESPGEIADEFEVIDKRWKLYRKRRDIRLPPEMRLPLGVSQLPRGGTMTRIARSPNFDNQLLATYDRLLEQHMPPSFLVDENFDLVHTFGGAERFLQRRGGRTTTDLVELVHPDLKTSLSGALQHAVKDDSVVRYTGVRVNIDDDSVEKIHLSVQPIHDPRTKVLNLLVKLEPVAPELSDLPEIRDDYSADELTQEHIKSLEVELRFSRENLQATIEELETANEELQATNEELVASNEELQSTNEELHSVNEELYTVNTEHQKKIEELTESNDDMDNLLETTRVGVIFLDRDLRIRRFTPEVAKIFDFLQHDVGRRISSFTHHLDLPDLLEKIQHVGDHAEEFERDVVDRDGHPYLLRILPYQTRQGVEGVVIALVDIASLRDAQDALRESEQFLRRTLDSLSVFAGVCTLDGTLIEANRPALLAANLKSEDVIGKPFEEAYWWSYSPEVQAQLRAALERARTGETVRYDVDVRLADDTFLAIDFHIAPMRDADGEITHLVPSAVDIGERREAERRLATEHAVTHILSDERTIPSAVSRVLNCFMEHLDVDVAEFWRVDESGQRLRLDHHYTSEAIDQAAEWSEARHQIQLEKGRGLPGVVWDELRPSWLTNVSEEFEGRIAILETIGIRTAYAIPVMGRDEFFGALCFFTRDSLDTDEPLLRMLTAVGSELGQFFSRIRSESELRLRDRAVSSATNGIVIADAEKDGFPIVYVNQGFEKITGYTPQDSIGRNCRFLQGKKSDPKLVAQMRRALNARSECRVTIANYKKDGALFWNDIHITPVEDESGTVTHFIGVQNDVTSRKRVEERLRRAEQKATSASEAKSAFLANVSHELRTPLTAILGFADVLSNRLDDEEDLDSAQTIRRNGDYLLELVNDILDLTKVEADRLEVHPKECDLPELIYDVRKLMQLRAQQSGIPLELVFESKIPRTFETDRIRLRQILVNLLSNAIKFTEEGCVKLIVDCRCADGHAVALRFRVVDTGIGMSKQTIAKLFQPFSQADFDVTQRFGGTGLGLSISKRLTDSLGGELAVESEFKRGSTFTLTLPCISQEVELVDAWDYDHAPLTEKKPIGRLAANILVADDRRDIWRVAKFFLEEAGGTTHIAEDGQQALDLVEQHEADGSPFDLILMDMQMPVLTGYDATRELRNRGFTAPIIALTAGAMKGDREKCLMAGCTDYFAKPIDGPQLVDLVRMHLPQTEPPYGKSDCESQKREPQKSEPIPLRVLVVEDSSDVARLMRKLLSSYGHEVETALSGAEALEVAADFQPEVYLLDLTLPDMNGFELMNELEPRAVDGARFIAVSGHDSEEIAQRSEDSGFETHVLKPIDPVQLNELISKRPE